MVAAGDITCKLTASTWRLTAALYAFRVAIVVLPVRWVAPAMERFLAAITLNDRARAWFVRTRVAA